MATYTQTMEDITPVGVGGWQEVDCGTASNSSVAEIIVLNAADAAVNTVGVRDTAEAVTKTLDLNEAEDGGNTAVRFLINVDSSGNVDLFRDSADVSYYLTSYWEGVTFTEQWESHNVGSKEDDMWFELAAANLSLQTDRVHLITVAHSDMGKNQVTGVRTTGSALERKIDMMEAEDGGVQCADFYVHTDAGDGNIEVWTDQFDDHTFYNQGYFDSAIIFTEKWVNINQTVGGWEDHDISGDIDQYGRVCDFYIGHDAQVLERNIGARMNGTGDARFFNIREAEGEGNSGYGISAQTDSSGVVELYMGVSVAADYFYLSGYFNVGGVMALPLLDELALTDPAPSFKTVAFRYIPEVITLFEDAFQLEWNQILPAVGLSLIDYWVTEAGALTQLISQSIDMVDYVLKTVSQSVIDTAFTLFSDVNVTLGVLTQVFLETIALAGYVLKFVTQSVIDTTNLSHYVTRAWTATNVLPESITLTSYLITAIQQILDITQVVALSDYILKAMSMDKIDTLTTLDFLSSTYGKYVIDTATISTYLFSTFGQSVIEALDVIHYLTYLSQTYRTWLQTLTMPDFFQQAMTLLRVESTVLTDYMFNTIGLSKIDTLTLTDYIVLASSSLLFEAISLFSDVGIVWAAYHSLIEAITLTDYLDNVISLLIDIYQSVDISDYLTYVSDWTQSRLETITLSDYITHLMSFLLEQTINISDFVSYTSIITRSIVETVVLVNYYMQLYALNTVQSISITDYLTSVWTSYLTNIDVLNITDYLFNKALTVLFESVSTSEYLTYISAWFMDRSESVTLSDYLLNLPSILLTQAVTLLDFLGTDITTGLLQQSITEAIAIIDYILIGRFKTITNALTLSDDGPFHGIGTNLDLSLNVTDYFDIINVLYRTLVESLTTLDYLTQFVALINAETIIAIDSMTRDVSFYRTYVESMTLLSYLLQLPSILMIESTTVTGYVDYISTWYRTWSEDLDIWSTLIPQLSGALQQTIGQIITVTDYLSRTATFYRYLIDTPTVVDYMFSTMGMIMSESTNLIDYLTYGSSWYDVIVESITLFSDINALTSGALQELLTEAIGLVDIILNVSTSYSIFSEVMSTRNLMGITWDVFNDKASLTVTDYLTYFTQWYRTDTGALSLVDYLTKTSSTLLYQLVSLVDYIGTDLTTGLLTQSMIEVLTLVDNVFKGIFMSNINPITFSTSLIIQLTGYLQQNIGQTIALIDYLIYDSVWYRSIVDPLSLFSDLTTSLVALLQQSVIQVITISDYLSKSTSTQLVQDLDLSSLLLYASEFSRLPLETLALTDYYARTLITTLFLPQGMTIIEYVSMSMSLLRIQGMTISIILSNSIAIPLADILNITDTYLLGISSYLTQSINIIDYASLTVYYSEALYEVMSLAIELFKTASLYRTASYALSDYWDRQVNFKRIYTYDITLSGFLMSAWSTSVEFVQGLIFSDPYLRVIILTILQMAESMTMIDSMAQMVPNVYKYLVMYMKDTTVDVFTKKMTATVYTRATAVALYIKRISQILYGKLRTSRR